MKLFLIISFYISGSVMAQSAATPSTGTSSLSTGSLTIGASPKDDSKPVAGSSILKTSYEIKPASASQFIVDGIMSLEKIVKKSENLKKKEADDEIKVIVSKFLDLDLLANGALAKYWNELASIKKKAFVYQGKKLNGMEIRSLYVKTFKKLVEENYLEKARKYITGEYAIPLTSEAVVGDKTVVTGHIKRTDADLIVEFILKPKLKTWAVVDVRLDDISLESTYRGSFNRVIKKEGTVEKGLPKLLDSMEKRLAEIKSGKATQL